MVSISRASPFSTGWYKIHSDGAARVGVYGHKVSGNARIYLTHESDVAQLDLTINIH